MIRTKQGGRLEEASSVLVENQNEKINSGPHVRNRRGQLGSSRDPEPQEVRILEHGQEGCRRRRLGLRWL